MKIKDTVILKCNAVYPDGDMVCDSAFDDYIEFDEDVEREANNVYSFLTDILGYTSLELMEIYNNGIDLLSLIDDDRMKYYEAFCNRRSCDEKTERIPMDVKKHPTEETWITMEPETDLLYTLGNPYPVSIVCHLFEENLIGEKRFVETKHLKIVDNK